MDPSEISEVETRMSVFTTVLTDYESAKAVVAACLAVLLYDHLLTFNREVTYLRSCRSGWARALFLINGYWPVIPLLVEIIAVSLVEVPKRFCYVVRDWLSYGSVPIHITIGIILSQRLYAMHDCNKALLYFLSTFLIVQIAMEVLVITLVLAPWEFEGLPPPFPACMGGISNRQIWACWLPLLSFDSVLFILAVVKAFKVAREDECHTPRLLTVLLRDSVAYFGGASAIAVANLILWCAARPSLVLVAVGPAIIAPSILGNRMQLNVHRAAQETYGVRASRFGSSFVRSELRFASDPALRLTEGSQSIPTLV